MTETETKKSLWRKLFALMLALCVCFSAIGPSVMAAEDDAYYDDEDYDDEDYDDEDYDDEDYDDEQTEWDGSEGIVLSDDELILPVGETDELFVYYDNEDEDEYEGKVTWESDEPSVASVKNGVVTAKKPGDASITAIVTIQGEEYEAYCDITVAKVTMASKEISVYAGQSATLKIKSRYPEDDRVDDWDIDEGEKFIKLSQKKNGSVVISGKKKGTAKVIVYMESGAEAACIVKVKAAVPTKTLSFAKKNISMAKGSKTTLKVTRTPKNATDTIKWTSSKKKVATVDARGTVTAKSAGKTEITAKTAKSKKAICTITVTAPAKLTLKNTNATLKVRKSANIKVKSGSKKGLTYKSSNNKVAVVNKKGKVTGMKPGKAKITVTAKNGAKAVFTVKVVK